MAKLYTISDWREGLADVYFDCPGCNCSHGVWTEKWIKDHDANNNPIYGPVWDFNKDMNKPTFAPSILVTTGHGEKPSDICHSFVKDGMIQFLCDCTHELKGQTVELPDI
jgi:hypothetical protein